MQLNITKSEPLKIILILSLFAFFSLSCNSIADYSDDDYESEDYYGNDDQSLLKLGEVRCIAGGEVGIKLSYVDDGYAQISVYYYSYGTNETYSIGTSNLPVQISLDYDYGLCIIVRQIYSNSVEFEVNEAMHL